MGEEEIKEKEEENLGGAIPIEISSLEPKKKKDLKTFWGIVAIVFILISVAFLYLMWTKAYYIQNHPCEICIDKYDAKCYLNDFLYTKGEGGIKITKSTFIAPVEQEYSVVDTGELDKLFEQLKNG